MIYFGPQAQEILRPFIDRAANVTDAQQRHQEAAEWRRTHASAPNPLRHNAATKIGEPSGLEAASATLGHSHADTMLIYAERPERVALEVAEKVG